MTPLSAWPWALAVVTLVVAWALIRRYALSPLNRLGRIIYSDDLGPAQDLYSDALGLAGRPDRVVRVWRPLPEERPVEIKTNAPPTKPPACDVAQLLMQAQLVAATWGRFPRYGYLCYAPVKGRWRIFTIRFGADAEELSLQMLDYQRSLA